ncbi:MAG: M23 family metallopeptidase [Bacteroidota bacterium]
MNVRNTESSIPGGFTLAQAEELGEAFGHAPSNDTFIIVAYLTAPLQIGADRPLWNRYVVFVDPLKHSATVTYEWQATLKDGNGGTVIQFTETGTPLFTISDQIADNPTSIANATTIEISLKIPEIHQTPLVFTQVISGLAQNVEDFIVNNSSYPALAAVFGHQSTTREVANTTKDYLIDREEAFGKPLSIPANLPTGLSYYTILKKNSTLTENRFFEASLNGAIATLPFGVGHARKTGVCQVKPHLLAMFYPANATEDVSNINSNGPQYTTLLPYQVIDGSVVIESEVVDDFDALPVNSRIDIYNLLRFPKSNILMAAFVLHQLKKTHSTWASITKEELKNNKDCLQGILTEFWEGPKGKENFTKSKFAKAVAAYSYSLYIKEILQATSSAIAYETIRIKVLDVRSGSPIRFAKVKRIIIDSSGDRIGEYEIAAATGNATTTAHEFAYNSSYDDTIPANYTDEQKLILKAQRALNELGYNHGPAGTAFGNNGRSQFNNYWAHRIKSGSPPFVSAGNPPEEELLLIIDEYESHRCTDDNGVLKVRVPKNLLDNRYLRIEVGFWEFPIAVEAMAYQSSTSRLTRSGNSNPNSTADTNFDVRWVGNQDLAWNSNIPAPDHFGWQVENPANNTSINLKVNEVLIPKDAATGTEVEVNQLSTFYDPIVYPFHFVVFGMQWCQPVWDEINIDADGVSKRSTGKAFTNRKDSSGKWIKNLNMHIVSKTYGGNNNSRANEPKSFGQYYGFYDRNPFNHEYRGTGRRHDGVDLYTGPSGNIDCFAVHGGKASNFSGGSFGRRVALRIYHPSERVFLSAHLSSLIASINGKIVLAGQKIGLAGRDGTAFSSSNEPSHLHFQLYDGSSNSTSEEPLAFLESIDPANAAFLPSNKLPIMLPCECKYGTGASVNPNGCNAGGARAHQCWALRKFPKYDWKNTRTNSGSANYHEFPNELKRINSIRWFACSYIHRLPETKLTTSLSTTGNEIELEVVDTSTFPKSGYLLIEDEIIRYSSKTTTKFKQCIRSQKGTSKASHSTQVDITYLNFRSYWIQAHLQFVFENKGKSYNGISIPNKDYFDPGGIDNVLDPTGTSWTSELSVSQGDEVEVTTDSKHGGKLVKIKKSNKVGWIRSNLIDADDKLTQTVSHLPKYVSNSRASIYFFREEELGIQNFTNYKKNFEVDGTLAKRLRAYMIELPTA